MNIFPSPNNIFHEFAATVTPNVLFWEVWHSDSVQTPTGGCGRIITSSTQDQERHYSSVVREQSATRPRVWESSEQAELIMDPIYSNEKSEKSDNPPAYQANMGYPPAQGAAPQGVYPPVQGYGATPYGAQPYSGQAGVTVQPTVFVTPAIQVNPIPDYLGYSIFTMLCCCLPLGIAALIYSINVSSNDAHRLPLNLNTNSSTLSPCLPAFHS